MISSHFLLVSGFYHFSLILPYRIKKGLLNGSKLMHQERHLRQGTVNVNERVPVTRDLYRHGHSCTLVEDRFLFIFGGYGNIGLLSDLHIYDTCINYFLPMLHKRLIVIEQLQKNGNKQRQLAISLHLELFTQQLLLDPKSL